MAIAVIAKIESFGFLLQLKFFIPFTIAFCAFGSTEDNPCVQLLYKGIYRSVIQALLVQKWEIHVTRVSI